MMIKVISYFFWGVLLIIIDINIGFIDVLPDIIGYILIIASFQVLIPNDSKFVKGMYYTIGLIAINILQILMGYSLQETIITLTLTSLAGCILQIMMMYYMHEAVHYVIDERINLIMAYNSQGLMISNLETTEDGWQALQVSNALNWKWYLYLGIANSILIAFMINVSTEIAGIVLVGAYGMVIISIWFLIILHKVKSKLEAEKWV